MNASEIENWLCERIGAAIGSGPAEIDRETTLTRLGLDSLTLLTLTGDLAEWLGRDLPSAVMWQHPTIARLAAALARPADHDTPERHARPPLSYAQENIWRYARAEHVRLHYQAMRFFLVRGPLDVGTLQRALDEIVRRHEHIRTTFGETDGVAWQQVHPPTAAELAFTDVSQTSDPSMEAERLLREAGERLLDLERGPLFVTHLVRIGPETWRLAFQLHHMLYDARSFGILYAEVESIYTAFQAGERSPLAELSLQMADFAAWERERLAADGTIFAGELRWWMDYWNRPLPVQPAFRFARPRPCQHVRPEACRLEWRMPAGFDVESVSQRAGTSPFVIYYAAFAAALLQHGGGEKSVLGTYVSNRSALGVNTLIGYFVNMVGMHVDLEGVTTWRDLVACIHKIAEEVSAHQEVQRHVLNDGFLLAGRTLPLPQAIFKYWRNPRPFLQIPGLEITQSPLFSPLLRVPGGLVLNVIERPELVTATLSFDGRIHAPAGVAALLESYRENLKALVSGRCGVMPRVPTVSWGFRVRGWLSKGRRNLAGWLDPPK